MKGRKTGSIWGGKQTVERLKITNQESSKVRCSNTDLNNTNLITSLVVENRWSKNERLENIQDKTIENIGGIGLKRFEIIVQVDPEIEEINVRANTIEQESQGAVYIDKKGLVFGVEEEVALGLIDSYGEKILSEMVGSTEFIMIYCEDSVLRVGSDNFVMGDLLIMKSENGLKCLTQEETKEAMKQFTSRLTSIKMGTDCMSGYQLC